MADFVTETRKEQPKNKRKKPDKKAKKEAKKSKISDTIEADLENSANDPVSDIQPVPEADFSDAESSASSKDSFFLDSEPENDEKSTVDSNRQPEKSQKSQSQNGSNFQQDLQLDYIKNSKFSHDKKRNYQEKRDLYYKQKFLDKQNNKSQAHLRNHTHLLKCEEKLHPSWQAKIANKRKMEELKNVKNSKVKFDSDSD